MKNKYPHKPKVVEKTERIIVFFVDYHKEKFGSLTPMHINK